MFRYDAFISYKHGGLDQTIAERLHRALERYRVPGALVKQGVKRRIDRVFRDAEELAAGDLPSAISNALEQSKFLIIICSPRSRDSQWVQKEVECFRNLARGGNHILLLLTDGDPASAFPPTLHGTEHLAPDVRAASPSLSVARLKTEKLRLLAAILGCNFDDLRQRHQERYVRRLVLLSFFSFALVLAFAILTAFVFKYEQDAKRESAEAKRQEGIAKDYAVESNRQEGIAKTNEVEANRQKGIAKDNEKKAIAEELIAQQRRYVAEFNLAGKSLGEAQIGNVRDLLNRQIPTKKEETDQRGFEWYFLMRLIERNLFAVAFKGSFPKEIAWSPDGRLLAMARQSPTGLSLTVGSWDNPKDWRLFKGHTGHINCLAFSPDGKRLATASNDKTVRIWDVASAEEVRTLKGHSAFTNSVAFSPDGKRLATASYDKTVKLWDAETFAELHTFTGHEGNVRSVAFSPDGKRLASLGGRTVKIWDAVTFAELRQLKCSHSDVWGNLCFGPDGKRLAACSFPDGKTVPKVSGDEPTEEDDNEGERVGGTVRVWDAATFEEIGTIMAHAGIVNAVCFSPDGKRIATCGQDKRIKLWDAATLKPIATILGHSYFVWGLAFHPDSRRLASVSGDYTMKIWDTSALQIARVPDPGVTPKLTVGGKATSSAPLPLWSEDVAFSPDGKLLASAGIRGAKVWDAATLEAICDSNKTLSNRALGRKVVAFSPDCARLAIAEGNRVSVRDARTLEILHTLTSYGEKGTSFKRLWVSFSPDGKRIAASADENVLKVWDAATFAEVGTLKGHASGIESAAFSPDGKLIATSDKEVLKFWDATRFEEVGSVKHTAGAAHCLAFATDSSRLAVGYGSGSVTIWDAATQKEVRTLRGHRRNVLCLAFSPDGKRLATGSVDRTVKFWDTATLDELYTLKGFTRDVVRLSFSPDSRRLATLDEGGGNHFLQIWDGREVTREERTSELDRLVKELPTWHRQQAEQFEKDGEKFAADYHRQRLRQEQKPPAN